MTPFETLRARHEALLARQDALDAADKEGAAALLADAQSYIAEVVSESSRVAPPAERNLLRAYLRYWGGYVYEKTGSFPRTELRPAGPAETGPEPTAAPPSPSSAESVDQVAPPVQAPARRPSWLPWLLAGLAVIGGAVILFSLLRLGAPASGVVTDADLTELAETGNGTTAEDATETPETVDGVEVTRPLVGSSGGEVEVTTLPPATVPPSLTVPPTPTPLASPTPTALPDAGGGPGDVEIGEANPPEVAGAPITPGNAAGLTEVGGVWAHHGIVLSLAFDPARPEFASAGADGATRIWSLPDLALLDYVYEETGWAKSVAYSTDGVWLATGGNDRVLRVYSREPLNPFGSYGASGGFIFVGRFNRDASLAAAGGGDGLARVWDLRSGAERFTVSAGGPAVYDLDFSPDGGEMATGVTGVEVGVQTWDATTGELRCALPGAVASLIYSPAGTIAAGTTDGRLLLIDPRACVIARAVEAHSDEVTDVAYSPDGLTLATASRDGTVKVWTAAGEPLTTLDAGVWVESAAFSPDGTLLAGGLEDGYVMLWATGY